MSTLVGGLPQNSGIPGLRDLIHGQTQLLHEILANHTWHIHTQDFHGSAVLVYKPKHASPLLWLRWLGILALTIPFALIFALAFTFRHIKKPLQPKTKLPTEDWEKLMVRTQPPTQTYFEI